MLSEIWETYAHLLKRVPGRDAISNAQASVLTSNCLCVHAPIIPKLVLLLEVCSGESLLDNKYFQFEVLMFRGIKNVSAFSFFQHSFLRKLKVSS